MNTVSVNDELCLFFPITSHMRRFLVLTVNAKLQPAAS